jgi:hypothetical protein
MKVICTNHKNHSGIPFHDIPKPDIGDEVTVVAEDNYKGVPTYILAEYSIWFQYDQRWFSPKSDIDETDLIKERKPVKQLQS